MCIYPKETDITTATGLQTGHWLPHPGRKVMSVTLQALFSWECTGKEIPHFQLELSTFYFARPNSSTWFYKAFLLTASNLNYTVPERLILPPSQDGRASGSWWEPIRKVIPGSQPPHILSLQDLAGIHDFMTPLLPFPKEPWFGPTVKLGFRSTEEEIF